MKIAPEPIASLESLGYTPQEARFLYIVATFAGYFVPRQFVAFAGVHWGKRSARFTRKLESRGHASWREYSQTGGVYHLCSRTLYRQIDKEHLRNHRRHSTDSIRTRLLALDFILQNQHCDYLETEAEKIRYFTGPLGIAKDALPAKAFGGPWRSAPVVRYFADQFPVFFETPEGGPASPVTFSYVDPGIASLAGFQHHLEAYKPLFRSLSCFRVVYLSNSPAHFIGAQSRFRSFLDRGFREDVSRELLRYFTLRAAWDQRRFSELSIDDVEWLKNATTRFDGPDTERLFSVWREGQQFTHALGNFLSDAEKSREVSLECRLVSPAREIGQERDTAGRSPAHPPTPEVLRVRFRPAMERSHARTREQNPEETAAPTRRWAWPSAEIRNTKAHLRRNAMALIKKPPKTVERRIQLEEPVSRLLDDYSRFVDCTPDYVTNFALNTMLARDPEYRKWKTSQRASPEPKEPPATLHARGTT